MNIDEINIEIIRQLRDGRKSFDEIAKILSVTPNTVRARVKKLTDSGILDIIGVVNPDKLDNHFLVIIGVRLKNMNLVRKAEAFKKLRGVVSVAVVTGQFDLMITALLNNEFGLLEFMTKEVAKVSDVLSTETFVVYKNYDMKIPYTL